MLALFIGLASWGMLGWWIFAVLVPWLRRTVGV